MRGRAKRLTATALCAGATVLALPAATPAARNEPDLTALPVGTVTTAGAARGLFFTCQGNFNGQGARGPFPWVHGSTYDLTQKYVVDGSVSWPGTFKEKFKGKRLRVSGNGLPTDHPTGIFPIQMSDDAYQADQNGSSIISYDLSLSLPRYPERNKKATCAGGEVGVSRSGVAIYSPLDALGRDAIAFELQDACGGHPNAMGYHYHGRPACSGGTSGKKHSKVIGWAFDGFPITGPLGDKGRYMGLDDLDKCHGHSHEIKYFGQRLKLFHYHATEEFPYVVGCFRGDPAVQQVNPGAGPQGGGGPPPPP